jgi:hypothetical protein
MLHDLSPDRIQRKLIFCQDLMRVYDIVTPGRTTTRGLTLFELNSVVLFSVNGIIGAGGAGKAEMTTIKQCEDTLRSVLLCLDHERPGTFEYVVLVAAKRQVAQCKEVVDLIGFLQLPSRQTSSSVTAGNQ